MLEQLRSSAHAIRSRSSFVVTDRFHDIPVEYTGILPDLFREGQSIDRDRRAATAATSSRREVLAKHDENYMPHEVADAIAKAKAAHSRRQPRKDEP